MRTADEATNVDRSVTPATRQAMEAVRGAGYTISNFASDADLELYFDVLHDGEDVGYISRGWTDPGFRLSRQICVSPAVGDDLWFEGLPERCATSGVCFTSSTDDDVMNCMLETVLYEEGFNNYTIRKSLEAMTLCSKEIMAVQVMLAAHAVLNGYPREVLQT